jgi:hypothetical protein
MDSTAPSGQLGEQKYPLLLPGFEAKSLGYTSRHFTDRAATTICSFSKMPYHSGQVIASRYVTVLWKILRGTEDTTK